VPLVLILYAGDSFVNSALFIGTLSTAVVAAGGLLVTCDRATQIAAQHFSNHARAAAVLSVGSREARLSRLFASEVRGRALRLAKG
jgi:hypothetical protein